MRLRLSQPSLAGVGAGTELGNKGGLNWAKLSSSWDLALLQFSWIKLMS